jgi:hypothetical protein
VRSGPARRVNARVALSYERIAEFTEELFSRFGKTPDDPGMLDQWSKRRVSGLKLGDAAWECTPVVSRRERLNTAASR